MQLRVDLLPRNHYRDVVVLIDVLRTCTVAPLLFDHGLKRLYLCPSVRVCRELAQRDGALLIGERRGLPPEGFNHANSPAVLRAVGLKHQTAVIYSENAPVVLGRLHGARHVLLGSLANAAAVVRRALALAREEIALVCAGYEGSEDLDDSFAAGLLSALLLSQRAELQPVGAAQLALTLLTVFPDPLEPLWRSRAGRALQQFMLHDDIALASFISQSDQVPELRQVVPFQRADAFCFDVAVMSHASAA